MLKMFITHKRLSPKNLCGILGMSLFTILNVPTTASAETSVNQTEDVNATSVQEDRHYTFAETVTESLTGDVYSEPSKWQDLSYSNLFSKGWDKPWASPPAGAGGAPRQGWLNAADGVFYRLGIATFGWQHALANNGDGYTGGLTFYTPLNQRFEFQTDIPIISNRGATGQNAQTNFGDLQITPRILLSESKELSQTLNVTFRMPTGNSLNFNSVAAISPNYNFWANYWKGLVVRGSIGFTIPYSDEIAATGFRSTFNANLAVGYDFTPHNYTPFGDMTWYVATNLVQVIDNRGPRSLTAVTIGPGFRTHVGDNWYLLGAVDVPVTSPQPYDYQVQGGIMKVF